MGPVTASQASRAWLVLAAAAGIALAMAAAAPARSVSLVLSATVVLALVGATLYLAWKIDPAYLLVAGAVATIFSSHWGDFIGLPGALSPQRLLLLAGVVAVLLGSPATRDWPRPRLHAVHAALILAVAYVLCSAAAAGTITNRSDLFFLLEAFGVLPFAVFVVAPMAFRTEAQRRILLAAFVGLGAYLGLTALFETTGPDALVFPAYINDPAVGIHIGRARGPFVEAVQMGFALYVCAVMSALALSQWRSLRGRLFAGATLVLCTAGLLFTLQRSVWLGAVVSTIVVALTRAQVRRRIVPIAIGALATTGIAIAALPAGVLQARLSQSDSVWARENLSRAALNLMEEKPLTGQGWGMFRPLTEHGDYFTQADDRPLYGVGQPVHNQFLNYLAELGLVGTTLWLAALLLALWGALRAPKPTADLQAWTSAILAVAVCYFVVASFVPRGPFLNIVYWLLVGVAWSGWSAARPAAGRAPPHAA